MWCSVFGNDHQYLCIPLFRTVTNNQNSGTVLTTSASKKSWCFLQKRQPLLRSQKYLEISPTVLTNIQQSTGQKNNESMNRCLTLQIKKKTYINNCIDGPCLYSMKEFAIILSCSSVLYTHIQVFVLLSSDSEFHAKESLRQPSHLSNV